MALVTAFDLHAAHNNRSVQKILERASRGELFFMPGQDQVGTQVENLWLSQCYSCKKLSTWVHGRIRYPDYTLSIRPNDDLPDGIQADFVEAVKVLDHSPRASAALLRLCAEKICFLLVPDAKSLNDAIGRLVQQGLDPRIQKSLDSIRLIGNNAVHPGLMNVEDDRRTAILLFKLINAIAESLISHPKRVDAIYDILPEHAKGHIERRDKPK